MAADQRKRRLLSSSTGFGHGLHQEQYKSKRRDLNLNSHIALKWDDNGKRVVAKEEQIGISGRHLGSYVPSVSGSSTKLADVVAIPKEAFELNELKQVLSYEVWESVLQEDEKSYLAQFLPHGFDPDHVVQALLNGDNFHFGNPFHKWSASLCSGDLHPDAIVHHEKSLKANKNTYCSELQKYHENMIKNLQKLKERCASSKDPEADILHMMSRSRRSGEKSILPNANGFKSRRPKENASAMSETRSLIADDNLYCSDNQKLSVIRDAVIQKSDNQKLSAIRDAMIQKRTCSEGIVKERHEKLAKATEPVKVSPKLKKAEKLQKGNINSNDGAKYMSYMKISKKQHELVKSMKQSGSSIQSKTLNRVLGNLDSFNVKPYEMFVEEEQKRIYEYWLNLANNDVPAALQNWRNRQSERRQLLNSLFHEMGEKLSNDEEMADSGSPLQVQDEDLVSSHDEELVGSHDEELVRSHDEELVGSPDEELVGSHDEELVGSREEELVGSHDEELIGSPDEELIGSREEELVGSCEELVRSHDVELVGSHAEELVRSHDVELVGSHDEEMLDPQDMDGECSLGTSIDHNDDPASQNSVSVDDNEAGPSSVQHGSPVSNSSYKYNEAFALSSLQNENSAQGVPLDVNEGYHLPPVKNPSSMHNLPSNVNKEFNPMDLNGQNNNVSLETGEFCSTMPERHAAPQISEACLSVSLPVIHSSVSAANADMPCSSLKNVWASVGLPESYHHIPTKFTSASEQSLAHPQVVANQPARFIDLESDLPEDATKDLLNGHANHMPFFNSYLNRGRSDLLHSLVKRDQFHVEEKKTGSEFHPTTSVLMEPSMFPNHFREQLQPSFALENRQKAHNELYGNQNIQENVFPDNRYSIQGQGHFSNLNVRDWSSARIPLPSIQSSQLTSGELLNPNWYATENRAHGSWSGSDGAVFSSSPNLGSGSNAGDQSLYSVLSQCNTLRAQTPYNTVSSTEQIIPPLPSNYGPTMVGGLPMTSTALPPQSVSPLDYLNGSETAITLRNTNMGWMSLGHQTPGLHDPSGKPFMKSWNQ